MPVTWVLEQDVFPDCGLPAAIREAGHSLVEWRDSWLATSGWPRLDDAAVVFRGSLGNAAEVRRRAPWRPGAYCHPTAFLCSEWYPEAARWLLQRQWVITTVRELVAEPERVLDGIGGPTSFFVRPDSPLKPFSGRVLSRDRLSLAALDHGFYYDDAALQIVVAPVRQVDREWRYVIVGTTVVAGSAYSPVDRSARSDDPRREPWHFASRIASAIKPPESVYVMDVCAAEGELFLVELNPFSGADLYACGRQDVVEAVSRAAEAATGTGGAGA